MPWTTVETHRPLDVGPPPTLKVGIDLRLALETALRGVHARALRRSYTCWREQCIYAITISTVSNSGGGFRFRGLHRGVACLSESFLSQGFIAERRESGDCRLEVGEH